MWFDALLRFCVPFSGLDPLRGRLGAGLALFQMLGFLQDASACGLLSWDGFRLVIREWFAACPHSPGGMRPVLRLLRPPHGGFLSGIHGFLGLVSLRDVPIPAMGMGPLAPSLHCMVAIFCPTCRVQTSWCCCWPWCFSFSLLFGRGAFVAWTFAGAILYHFGSGILLVALPCVCDLGIPPHPLEATSGQTVPRTSITQKKQMQLGSPVER